MTDVSRNEFGWNSNDLKLQFRAAKDNGWLEYFSQASNKTGIAEEKLLAIASRESGYLWHKGPAYQIIGDSGHAWGPFQVNNNSHPNQERSTELNIMQGATILAQYQLQLDKKPEFAAIEDDLVKAELLYSSYNRGANGAFSGYERYGDASYVTAHNNYGKDVIAREAIFKALLEESSDGSN